MNKLSTDIQNWLDEEGSEQPFIIEVEVGLPLPELNWVKNNQLSIQQKNNEIAYYMEIEHQQLDLLVNFLKKLGFEPVKFKAAGAVGILADKQKILDIIKYEQQQDKALIKNIAFSKKFILPDLKYN